MATAGMAAAAIAVTVIASLNVALWTYWQSSLSLPSPQTSTIVQVVAAAAMVVTETLVAAVIRTVSGGLVCASHACAGAYNSEFPHPFHSSRASIL